MHDCSKGHENKTIGGPIPQELYWEYKQAQADRKESATQALINAIRLYVDVTKKTEGAE